MANSAEVLNHLLGHPPVASAPIAFNFLVPNLKGLQNFLKASDTDSAPTTSSQEPTEIPTPPPSPKPEESGETGEQAPITSTQDPNELPPKTSGKPSSIQPDTSSAPSNTMEVSLFTAATETFSKTNTNCTIAESLERCKPIVSLAKSRNIRVRGYVSVALGCPYEGPEVSPAKVAEITATLLEMGADEVSVADTTGMGPAPKTLELL